MLRGQNIIARGPHGGLVDGSFLFPGFVISTYDNGSSQLVDLSNLNNAREGTNFSQLPPGVYDLQIILHTISDSLDGSTSTESISTQIEIRLPSLAEEEYLKQATEIWFKALPIELQKRTALPHMIEWRRALSQNVLLTDLDTKLLSAEAKELISYHMLMSTVFMFTGNLNNLEIDSLRKLTVPEYLELEKECFILEVRILRGEENAVKSQIEKLLLRDPRLWWRISRAQKKTSDFLGFLSSEISPVTH